MNVKIKAIYICIILLIPLELIAFSGTESATDDTNGHLSIDDKSGESG